jgi:hypothetical protein
MLKRCAVVLASVVLALCPLIRAQEGAAPVADPTQVVPEAQRASREDVERFFTAMRMRQNVQMVFKAMRQQIRSQSQTMMSEKLSTLTPDEQKRFQETMAVSMEEVLKVIQLDDMISDMIPVYQKYLTKEDLEGITTFYSSPVGQRLLDKTPAMTAEAMTISMQRMQKMMPEIIANMQKRMDQFMKDVEKEKSATPQNAPKASKS